MLIILGKTGASSIEEVQTPLAAMPNETAIHLVMRWMAERKRKSAIIQLQLHNKEKSIMHYIGVRANAQHLCFLYGVTDLRISMGLGPALLGPRASLS